MEEQEKIIAYRIGEVLFCPGCYENAARDLKAAQNPDDPEVKLPSKAIKAGDIKIFICEQCKTVKTSSGEESCIPAIEKEKELLDLEDMLVDCGNKISFVSAFFCQQPPGYQPELSESDGSGLHCILREIEGDLNFVVDEISKKKKAGKIKEVN